MLAARAGGAGRGGAGVLRTRRGRASQGGVPGVAGSRPGRGRPDGGRYSPMTSTGLPSRMLFMFFTAQKLPHIEQVSGASGAAWAR